MTAPPDLIVAPRPEPVASRAPKSQKISGAPEGHFADHVRKTDDGSVPSAPHETQAATGVQHTHTNKDTHKDRHSGRSNPGSGDAEKKQPGGQTKTKSVRQEQNTARAPGAQIASLISSQALSTAKTGAVPGNPAAPAVPRDERALPARPVKDILPGKKPGSAKTQKNPLQKSAPAPERAALPLNTAPPASPHPGGVPVENARPLVTSSRGPAAAAPAQASPRAPRPGAPLQKKSAVQAGTDSPASLARQIAVNAPAAPASAPSDQATAPAAIPQPPASPENRQPVKVKVKSSKPATLAQALSVKPAPAQSTAPIGQTPDASAQSETVPSKHALNPPGVTEEAPTPKPKHTQRTKGKSSRTGKAGQTVVSKPDAPVKAPDTSAQQSAPTVNQAVQNTLPRAPFAAHLLQNASPDSPAVTADVQSSTSLSAPPVPGAHPSPFAPVQTIRLTNAAGAAALPIRNIAVQMSKHLKAGINRFEIRIDPPEMGRIHVRMEMTHDGRVQAVLSADRSDTLDLLQRDAKMLAQSLDKAGLNVDSGSLKFSLHDGGGGQSSFSHSQHTFTPTLVQNTEKQNMTHPDMITAPLFSDTYGFRTSAAGGINIQV